MDEILLRFRQKFIDEANSLVNGLEKSLLELEANPENKGCIDEVFRVMHTLKGISSMYGFDRISEYTHKLETIFDLIREEKLIVSEDIIDLTFSSCDHILNLLNDEKFVKIENQAKHDELISLINLVITSNKDIINLIRGQKTEELNNNSTEKRSYYIHFVPDETLFKRAINIVGIFDDLSKLGEYQIFKHNYADFPDIENKSENAWGIFFTSSADFAEIQDVFMFVEDQTQIIKISNKDVFNRDDLYLPNESEDLINDYFQPVLDDELEEEVNENENINPFLNKDQNETQKKTVENSIDIQTIEKHFEPKKLTEEIRENIDPKSFVNLGKQVTTRISIDSEKLDHLMYLVSELVTTNAQLTLANKNSEKILLDNAIEKVEKLTKQFRDNALNLRLIPINDILIRFQRLIRDLSHSLKKEIRFTSQGTDTELDKSIIDILVEPIMHLIRNCIDHGIELPESRIAMGKPREGTIKLTAFYAGTNVLIRIEDDGNGINTEKILAKAIEKGFVDANAQLSKKEILNLIFIPGFSMAKSLTEVSGRGVGMDVVKRKIDEVRGEVSIDSEIGKGTSFTIKLQQTVSIIDTLLIKAQNTHFMIPLSEVEVCDSRLHSELFRTYNRQVEFNQGLYPFVHLRSEFNLDGEIPVRERLVFINRNDNRIAIVADKILGEHQAVLKPLGNIFKKQEFLLGASVLGDGNMALMLDTAKLVENIFSKNVSIT